MGLIQARLTGDSAANRARQISYTLKQKLEVLPRVAPFLLIIAGILFVLYGGVATPSEAAGIGAVMCLALVVIIYRMTRVSDHWAMLRSSMREAVMILMIIAAAELFSYMMSTLYITQSLALWIADLEVGRWVLMAWINLFLLVAGFFLPPVAVILMTAPDAPADHRRGRVRSDLVCGRADHQHGDRPDHPRPSASISM